MIRLYLKIPEKFVRLIFLDEFLVVQIPLVRMVKFKLLAQSKRWHRQTICVKRSNYGSSVSSTENDINTRLAKAWTAIDRLWVIWKSDLSEKIKRNFFQATVMSKLLYGCTTRMLIKRTEKKLYGNCTRMLRAILNKSWSQHPKNNSCTATYYPPREPS